MKIAILGYGRMGHEAAKLSMRYNHKITAIFDIEKPFTTNSNLNDAEVIIDFTLQNAVLDSLKTAAHFGIPIVEGTTGWNDQIGLIDDIENLTTVYSPNFSIGMYLFTKITKYAAELFGSVNDYDCYLHEWHHIGKVDSPSGTAKKLAGILIDALPQKQKALFATSDTKIDPNTLHVTSTRVGRVPGTHEIGFDSQSDSILLKHSAHSREGFAFGAIKAAEWVKDKKGIFTMDDFINSILKDK